MTRRRAPTYAQKVDANQSDIVRELLQIPGVSVEVIGKPLDLLIGYQKRTYLVEIKRKDKVGRASAYTPAQQRFFRTWTGQYRVATSAEEIIKLITESYQ